MHTVVPTELPFGQPPVARPCQQEPASAHAPRHTLEASAQLRVSDNGIGFDEKYAEQIFTVFQRLHARGEYEGTGIGLAVCRKITDRHGGSILARSAAGHGATFIVTLPTGQHLHESRSADPG